MLKLNNIFRAVLETTPDTVLIIDENNVVVYCNENIKNTFGYEPNELMDRDMSILIPLELREGHNNGIKRFLNSGVPKLIGKTVEIIGLHKNGTKFPMELSLSFWTENGKTLFSSIIRDISEGKRILKEKDDLNNTLQEQKKEKEALLEELRASNEELNSTSEKLKNLNESLEKEVYLRTKQVLSINVDLVKKNRELEKLNIDLDNFIYTASHDLKSPIVNLEGLVMVLKQHLLNPTANTTDALIDMMETSISKLHKTILDLTEITKVQKGLSETFEEVSFQEIMDDIKADQEQNFQLANPKLEVYFQVSSIIYARRSLRSILYNLLTNAIKYKSQDRQLEINIRTFKEGDFVILSVQDNGLGMNEQQLPRLFTMFKRFHTHVEGTGIGLYIVKRIIENSGGKIVVDTIENVGSTFKVYIPQKPVNY